MDLNNKIVQQIEYYFGDRNLFRDKFLNSQIEKTPEKWVPISILLTFNRLKSLAENAETICRAISVVGSSLVETNEEQNQIRRIPINQISQLTQESVEEERNRTVYMSGFPVATTMDSLLEFVKAHGPILDLIRRREKNKFSGSVFCVFKNLEDAEKFVGNTEVAFNDVKITGIFSREFYEKNKKTEKEEKVNREKSQIDEARSQSILLIAENLPTEAKVKEIRAFFNFHVPTVFVDRIEERKGIVRMQSDQTADSVIEQILCAVNGNLVMDECAISLRTPDDQETEEFWNRYVTNFNKKFVQKTTKNNKPKNNNARHNKRKIFTDDEPDESSHPAKVPRLEETRSEN